MNRTIKTIALTLIGCTTVSMTSHAQEQFSPNGRIKVGYADGRGLVISYKDDSTWQEVMTLASNCSTPSKARKEKVAYDMVLGKKSRCTNACTTCTWTNTDGRTAGEQDKQTTIRVYNDGVAWQGAHESVVDFSAAQNNWLMKWTDSYEGFFPKNRERKDNDRYGYPALFEYRNGTFALLSESGISRENAGTSMWCVTSEQTNTSTPQHNTFALKPDGNEDGGWQTLIIGKLADVVESTLITDNSAPCTLDDTRWIKPGVASWIYWAHNHGSNDYRIIKQYVDMAVEMKMPYVLIDAEWDEMDKIAANEGKTIEDGVRYATEHGIMPIIWYNSSVGWINGAPGPKFRLNKQEEREKEFAWCEKIGVKGVKIDFFSGDTHLNIEYMADLLECAARHHLLVNFHGATIPRGWQRTYPNFISNEGVYGAEWYNNVPTFTDKAAAHNATIPFTRNVIGSMDYTPCAFSDSQHPHITTHAHELALTVIYESGIQHIADRPESLLSQPKEVREFFGTLPTAWDETRLLGGYPGESVVMARRKGTTWYIAGINGTDTERDMAFSMDGLKGLGKNTTLFQDSGNAASPWFITHDRNIRKCSPRGGFVLVVSK